VNAAQAEVGRSTRQPTAGFQVRESRARRWRWWSMLAGVLAIAGSVLLAKAAVYQPLGWGEDQFRPIGVGIRPVNQFGHYRYDYYVPPQRGKFTFVVSITNTGSRPVIIEGLSVRQGVVGLVGPVFYTTAFYTSQAPFSNKLPSGSPVLHDVTLGAGRSIVVAIAMRTSPCATPDGWTSIPSFFVKERFLFFTHTVALPWSMAGGALIMRLPGGRPGQPGAICAPK
jgi:hypothetical protein